MKIRHKPLTGMESRVRQMLSTRIWKTPRETKTSDEMLNRLFEYEVADRQMRDGAYVYRLKDDNFRQREK